MGRWEDVEEQKGLGDLGEADNARILEIDHNFSKAHRIVTGSILPVVEQYGEHCRAVWDASKVRGNEAWRCKTL